MENGPTGLHAFWPPFSGAPAKGQRRRTHHGQQQESAHQNSAPAAEEGTPGKANGVTLLQDTASDLGGSASINLDWVADGLERRAPARTMTGETAIRIRAGEPDRFRSLNTPVPVRVALAQPQPPFAHLLDLVDPGLNRAAFPGDALDLWIAQEHAASRVT